MNYRAHLAHRSQVLRCLRHLAVAKAKLKDIRSLFYNISYRRRISHDSEERQRFADKIIALLATVDALEVLSSSPGPHQNFAFQTISSCYIVIFIYYYGWRLVTMPMHVLLFTRLSAMLFTTKRYLIDEIISVDMTVNHTQFSSDSLV